MDDKTIEKLNKTHAVDKVYAKVDGGNDQITFDAMLNGEKIPVTTVNHNRMETHFVFKKADEETEADAKTE